jgi:hypothetical protein
MKRQIPAKEGLATTYRSSYHRQPPGSAPQDTALAIDSHIAKVAAFYSCLISMTKKRRNRKGGTFLMTQMKSVYSPKHPGGF